MSLFTIGDLHLSFTSDKPMHVFGDQWENHAEKLRRGFSCVSGDDLTVVCGDISWGMDLEQCREDFLFIDRLPGKKLILKGNHDYWWSTAAKAKRFFAENTIESIDILHNNCFYYEDLAICGTRGWFYEEETGAEHDRKIMLRELGRLETSLKAAGDREKLPEEEDIERLLEREMPPAFVITNEQGLCGAAAVLYPGVLRSVAEYFEDDLYLIPSSIHEMILVPTRLKADREEVDRMIREVNATVVSEEEVLNERCLCYRRSDGHFD